MTTALVLSGGGAVGIAWQTGFAAGLASEGVDLADADWILGTSAGSATGAQLALRFDMAQRVDRYRQRAGQAVRGTVDDRRSGNRQGGGAGALSGLMEVMRSAGSAATPEERRKMIGAYALAAETGPEDGFVESFRYLDGHDWPAHYRCTAVDAESGEFVVWDQAAGLPLAQAVASSCAVPGVYPPITINGRRYIDGGMRSATSADLAIGHDKVLVLSMRFNAGATGDPQTDARIAQARATLDREQKVLHDASAEVLVTGPDDEAAASFGTNLLSGSNLSEVAEQGLRQGAKGAAELRDFWLD
jgi:NTE family protein